MSLICDYVTKFDLRSVFRNYSQVSLDALAADGVEFEGIESVKLQMGDVFQILRLLWIVILRYQVTLWDENGIIESDPVNCLINWLKDHVKEIDER